MLFLLRAPPAPGAGALASRALAGMEKQREPEPGRRARCAGCAKLLGGRGAVRLTPGKSPRCLAYPAPLSGEGLHPSPLGTPLCRTSRILAFPCASLAPPPALSAGYFYPLLVPRCFWGDSGEAGPNPLSSRCAPRSGPLLAGSSRKEQPRDPAGAQCAPSSSGSQGSGNLGTDGSTAPPAARRGSQSPDEFPAPGRRYSAGFCGCSLCARRIHSVPLVRSPFAGKSHLVLLKRSYQLPLKG